MSQPPSDQPSPRPPAGLPLAPDRQRELVLIKRGQRYVFSYSPGHEAQVLAELVALVRDPANELSWFDAAVLTHQMGQGMVQRLGELLES